MLAVLRRAAYGYTIVCIQPLTPTQLCTLSRTRNEYWPKAEKVTVDLAMNWPCVTDSVVTP